MKKINLWWLWLVAFLPRLLIAIAFFDAGISLDDMYQYDMLARSLAEGRGFRWYSAADFEPLRSYYTRFLDVEQLDFPEEGIQTAHRGPGYPTFLSLIYRVTPETTRFGWVRVIQAGLMAGLAPLIALIALSYGLSRNAARLSGWAAAWYPLLLFYPVGLASENLFLPLLVISVQFLLSIPPSGRISRSLLTGVLLGLTALTRSVISLFLPLSAWWIGRRVSGRWTVGLLVLVTAVGITLPWAVRNSMLMGKGSFLESSLGYNLFISYHPEGDGGFDHRIAVLPLQFVEDRQREDYALSRALEYIRDDPGEALERVVRKTAYFLGVEDKELVYFYTNNQIGNIPQPWLSVLYVLFVLPWLLILLLAPLGMLLHRQRAGVSLSLLLFAGYTLPHLLIIAEPRFHLALVPVLLPFAASAWESRKSIHEKITHAGWKRPYLKLGLTWAALAGFSLWYLAMRWPTLVQVMTSPHSNQLYLAY